MHSIHHELHNHNALIYFGRVHPQGMCFLSNRVASFKQKESILSKNSPLSFILVEVLLLYSFPHWDRIKPQFEFIPHLGVSFLTVSFQFIPGLNSIIGHFDNLNLYIEKDIHMSQGSNQRRQGCWKSLAKGIHLSTGSPHQKESTEVGINSPTEIAVSSHNGVITFLPGIFDQQQAGISSPRRLIIIYKISTFKILHLMASLRKRFEEKYDEVILSKWHLNREVCKSANGIPAGKFAKQQMASRVRSLQNQNYPSNGISQFIPARSLMKEKTLQIVLSWWDICTQIN